MAKLTCILSTVDNKGAAGTPFPALRGSNAQFLILDTAVNKVLQRAAADWVAGEDGFMYLDPGAAAFFGVFFTGATPADPAEGSGWPIRANAPMILTYKRGDKFKAADA